MQKELASGEGHTFRGGYREFESRDGDKGILYTGEESRVRGNAQSCESKAESFNDR